MVCDGSSREEHISACFVEKELSNDATLLRLTNTRQIEDTDDWSSLYHQPSTFCLFGWLVFLWHESLPALPKTKTRVLHSRGSVCEVWADVAEVVDKAANTLYWRCTVLLTTLLFQLVHPSQVTARPRRKRPWMKRIRRVETDKVSSSISQLEYLVKVILRSSLSPSHCIGGNDSIAEMTGGQLFHIQWSVLEF